MILGGINITDETSYTTSVKVPEINGEGRYDAEIKVTDADNAVTTVTRRLLLVMEVQQNYLIVDKVHQRKNQ